LRSRLHADGECSGCDAIALMQANLSDTSGARQLAEDAATCTSATLNSLKKKAHAYKKENKTLLTNYDDWLKTLVSQRGQIPASYDDDVPHY